jgi:hypothetical protein
MRLCQFVNRSFVAAAGTLLVTTTLSGQPPVEPGRPRSANQKPPAARTGPTLVVAYEAVWSLPNPLRYPYCTHVIEAFAYVDRNAPASGYLDATELRDGFGGTVRAVNPACKVLVCLGDRETTEEDGAVNFRAVCSDGDKRAALVKAVADLVDDPDHAYDGVDIDWEFLSWDFDDPNSHVELLADLRSALPDKLLTFAVQPFPGDQYLLTDLAAITNYCTLMGYDYNYGDEPLGPWVYEGHADVKSDLERLALEYPVERLVLAMPFYCKWGPGEYDAMAYKDFSAPQRAAIACESFHADYLEKVFSFEGHNMYVNDHQSLAAETKAALFGNEIEGQNIGGVGAWQLGHDTDAAELIRSVHSAAGYDQEAPQVAGYDYLPVPTTDIVIEFGEVMYQPTLTPQNITVSGSTSGWVDWDGCFDPTDLTLTIDPVSEFARGETITVTLSTAVADLAGNGLQASYEFSFDIDLGWCQLVELTPDDSGPGDEFGVSLDIGIDRIVVGARGGGDNGIDCGSAYVFAWDGSQWIPQVELLPGDGARGDWFGNSVAMADGRIVVGAPLDDDKGSGSGSAYVFAWNGNAWAPEGKLLAPDGAAGDEFGFSVAISGERVVAGARFHDHDVTDCGSAYVFAYDGDHWIYEAELLAKDRAPDDWFGRSVAVDGDRIVVGAWGDDEHGANTGAAYVFTWQGTQWDQEAKLLAKDGAADDWFGNSVAIAGDRAVIGARYEDGAGDDSGAVYVFAREGTEWLPEAKVLAEGGAPFDEFGASVSIDADRMVVGAYRDDDTGSNAGSAYVFAWNGARWIQLAKLLGDDGVAGDEFGAAAAISGELCVAGAHFHDDNGVNSGSAYVFALGPDNNGNGIPDPCECVADLDGDGDTDHADLAVVLADWGCASGNCPGDVDADGDTDHSDLGILLADWGCTP